MGGVLERVPTVPMRALGLAAFLGTFGYATSLYLFELGSRHIPGWLGVIYLIVLFATPLIAIAAGLLAGTWRAVWLIGLGWLGLVCADIVVLGLFDGCGQNDECKPPSLVVAILGWWAFGLLGMLVFAGVLLREKPRAAFGMVGLMLVCVGLIWLVITGRVGGDTDIQIYESSGRSPNSAVPVGPIEPADIGPLRVAERSVAASVGDVVGASPVQVSCAPAFASGIGQWACRVNSPNIQSAQPVVLEVSAEGGITGDYTDSRGLRHPFDACCLPVDPQ